MTTIQDLIDDGEEIEGRPAFFSPTTDKGPCFQEWESQNTNVDDVLVIGMSGIGEGFVEGRLASTGTIFHFDPNDLIVKE